MVLTYLRMMLFWIYIFFLERVLLVCFLLPKGFSPDISWWQIFARGLRFDVMVTAYLSAPLLVSMLVPLLMNLPNPWMRQFWHRLYLVIITLAVGIVTGLDFASFAATGDRLNENSDIAALLRLDYSAWPLVAAELGLLLLVVYQIQRWIRVKMNLSEVTGVRWIFCAILLVAMGRGSVGPYHLDLRFSEISSSVVVRRVIIPSCYAFDQALRHRR